MEMGKTVQKVRRNVTAPPGPGGAAVRLLPAHGGEEVRQGVLGHLFCRVLHGGEIQGAVILLQVNDQSGVVFPVSETSVFIAVPVVIIGTKASPAVEPAVQGFVDIHAKVTFILEGLSFNDDVAVQIELIPR